jgi:hypothetical protein
LALSFTTLQVTAGWSGSGRAISSGGWDDLGTSELLFEYAEGFLFEESSQDLRNKKNA